MTLSKTPNGHVQAILARIGDERLARIARNLDSELESVSKELELDESSVDLALEINLECARRFIHFHNPSNGVSL